ncbi:putative aTPase/kinase [Acinetobacter sp. 1294596]|nr:putative aTPase/kinase [Acinetobacter sp. 1294596]
MGIHDYLEIPNALFLFEWPSKGGSEIPQADLIIDILKSDDDLQRQVSISTESAELFNKLREKMNVA